MKKILKSFTFWFLVLAAFEIFMHQIGQDSKNIVLIGLNPVLKRIASSNGVICELMNNGWIVSCKTVAGSISINWYIGSVLTLALYGIILDCIKNIVMHIHKQKK